MKMKMVLLMLMVGASGFLAGCGQELFVDANNNDRRIDTYYDGDSAVKTRENRQNASDMGFGYPSQMFQQQQ